MRLKLSGESSTLVGADNFQIKQTADLGFASPLSFTHKANDWRVFFEHPKHVLSPTLSDSFSFVDITVAASVTRKPKRKALDDFLLIFQRVAQSETLEYGVESACDQLIAKWSTICGDFGDIVNHIFLQTLSQRVSQVALLKALSHLDYDLVYPQGQTIAIAALASTDCEVAEAGIRAFENWGRKEGIACLESSKVHAKWLEQYRVDTLSYLYGL